MKLIAQERLDAAKGHTEGPWRIPEDRWGVVVADHPIPEMRGADETLYYGGHMVAESVAKKNLAAIALAPELLAENEMLRELLTEAMNVSAGIMAHASHLRSTDRIWRAERIEEAATALTMKLDEVLP